MVRLGIYLRGIYMNKINYIDTLTYILKTNNVRKSSINNIINTYSHLYDDLVLKGRSFNEIINILGTPAIVYQTHQHQLRHYPTLEQVFLYATPIWSSILFLLLYFLAGLSLELSAYSFFLIPFVIVLSFFRNQFKIISLVVVTSVFTHLLIGSLLSIWDPTWVIMFLIPISLVIFYAEDEELIYSLLFFIAIPAIYLLNFYEVLAYEYSWQLILSLIIVNYFIKELNAKKIIGFISLIISIVLYNSLIIFTELLWTRAIYVYLIWIITIVLSGEFLEIISNETEEMLSIIVYMGSILLYILTSVVLGNWIFPLLIFFVIPLYYIIKHRIN